ncbi:hypothetical protein ACRAWD_29740 [Caulobacter segnis]
MNAVKDAKTGRHLLQRSGGRISVRALARHQPQRRRQQPSSTKAPPASYANAPINYDIYTYDARGRYGYVRVSAKFWVMPAATDGRRRTLEDWL